MLTALLIGIVVVTLGWWTSTTVTVLLTVAGIALIVACAVHPLLSSAALGDRGWGFANAREARRKATEEIYEQHLGQLTSVARQLSGEVDVSAYIRQAMASVYEMSALIPRTRRVTYAMGQLVDAIADSPSAGRPIDLPREHRVLMTLDYESRCAHVLAGTAHLDLFDIAEVLGRSITSVRVLLTDTARRVGDLDAPAEG